MDPNPVELFLHVVGVIGMFTGFGTLLLGVTVLGRTTDINDARAIGRALTVGRRIGLEYVSVIDGIVVVSVLLIGATGLHMAVYTGDWQSAWVKVAIGTFILLAPVGILVINPRLHAVVRATEGDRPSLEEFRSRVRDPVLAATLQGELAVLVGLVFLMAVKPASWILCGLIIIGAAGVGAASAVLRRRHPEPAQR